jgi:hypothetical protein
VIGAGFLYPLFRREGITKQILTNKLVRLIPRMIEYSLLMASIAFFFSMKNETETSIKTESRVRVWDI